VPEQSEFFKPLEDEISYYRDSEDLNNKLIELIENEVYEHSEKAEVFVHMNSAEKIAQIYIELFTRILKKR